METAKRNILQNINELSELFCEKLNNSVFKKRDWKVKFLTHNFFILKNNFCEVQFSFHNNKVFTLYYRPNNFTIEDDVVAFDINNKQLISWSDCILFVYHKQEEIKNILKDYLETVIPMKNSLEILTKYEK